MKFFIFGLLTLICSNVNAEWEHDGIWYSENIGYFSIKENDGNAVVIRLDEKRTEWEAFLGKISGNTLKIETIASDTQAIINVTFTSEDSFSATQESCSPLVDCSLPDGFSFQGKKVW